MGQGQDRDMGQEKTTIKAAAKALNISIKTIQRYLNSGTLSKVKEGNRTYILVDEIRTLRQGQDRDKKEPVRTEDRDRDTNIITVNRNKYEELLQELGHYKGQLQGHTKYLLEYKETIKEKDRTLSEQKIIIEQQSKEIENLRDIAKRAEDLEAEIARLKNRSWWQKIFSRG